MPEGRAPAAAAARRARAAPSSRDRRRRRGSATAAGGAGPAPRGRQWLEHRNRVPGFRGFLEKGIVVDTIEVGADLGPRRRALRARGRVAAARCPGLLGGERALEPQLPLRARTSTSPSPSRADGPDQDGRRLPGVLAAHDGGDARRAAAASRTTTASAACGATGSRGELGAGGRRAAAHAEARARSRRPPEPGRAACPMPELLLGLDLGTTRVPRSRWTSTGRVRGARAAAARARRYPGPGRVEQDPEEMVTQSVEALRAALAGAGGDARDVAGARHRRAARDRARVGREDAAAPLAPAIGWQDQRGAARAAELTRAGRARRRRSPRRRSSRRGSRATTRGTARSARPRSAGTLRLGTPDAWLGFRLGAEHRSVTDPGHASCTGALRSRRAAAGASGRSRSSASPREALPEIVATAERSDETAAALLGVAVPIARARGRPAGRGLRAGRARAGRREAHARHVGDARRARGRGRRRASRGARRARARALAPRGRAGATRSASRAPRSPRAPRSTGSRASACCPRPRSSTPLAAPSSGGAWFVPALQGLGTPAHGLRRARRARRPLARDRPRPSSRAPRSRASRSAAPTSARRSRFADSVLPVDGGLAQSDVLLQLLADLTGAEVRRAAEVETTALGAAQLAGLAVGALPDLAACRALSAPAVRLLPKLGEAERGAERARWKERVEGSVARARARCGPARCGRRTRRGGRGRARRRSPPGVGPSGSRSRSLRASR